MKLRWVLQSVVFPIYAPSRKRRHKRLADKGATTTLPATATNGEATNVTCAPRVKERTGLLLMRGIFASNASVRTHFLSFTSERIVFESLCGCHVYAAPPAKLFCHGIWLNRILQYSNFISIAFNSDSGTACSLKSSNVVPYSTCEGSGSDLRDLGKQRHQVQIGH